MGITDTGYGEDHCWANHFDVVIDINSTDPFPPLVKTNSPCQEIHSAEVLSQKEKAAKTMGLKDYRDPRRHCEPLRQTRVFKTEELQERLATQLHALNRLTRRFKEREHAISHELTPFTRHLSEANSQLERVVTEFNCSVGPEKKRMFSTFRSHARAAQRISSRVTKRLRPLSLLSCRISNVLEETRLALSPRSENL